MTQIRIIPKLDIKNGFLIKGINLDGLRILGDPNDFALNYYNNNADEIIYLDSVATLYGTNNLVKFIKKTAKNIFIPLIVGGGIRSIKDIEKTLENGADRVALNSAVVDDIKLLKKSAKLFGSSTITITIEAIKYDNKYYVSKSSGRDTVKIDPKEWAKEVEDNGAGEILLTSVNKEGLKLGFDLKLSEQISSSLSIPVIAHGGAGKFEDVYKVINYSNISGVAISGLFHYDVARLFKFKSKNAIGNVEFLQNLENKKYRNNLLNLKKFLFKKGIDVRL